MANGFEPDNMMCRHPPYLQVLHSQIQLIVDGKYTGKEIPESSKKQKLNFLHLQQLCVLYRVYNSLCSVCIVLGITSDLEMI